MMCGAKESFYLYLPLALFFVFVTAALRAGEGEPAAYMPMYLISEAELRSIGEYQAGSEREKQSWLLRVQESKAQADSLRKDSEILNSQLSTARERNRILEQSFNEYEAESLTAISTKNGEIAGLKQAVADKTLEAEKYKGKALLRLVIIISLLAAIAGYTAFKVCRFFRLI
jgi:hypothetical protein